MFTKPKTTDYYKLLASTVTETIKPFYEHYTKLSQLVDEIRKSLKAEQDLMTDLKAQMQQMKDRPLDFESDDQPESVDTLKSFKERALSLVTEIQAAELMCNSLQIALDKKTSELNDVTHNLKNKLMAVVRENRSIADEQVNGFLQAAFDERNAFLAAFDKIYEDFGQSLYVSDETLIPGVLNQADVEDLMMRIHHFESIKKQEELAKEVTEESENQTMLKEPIPEIVGFDKD